MTDARSSSVDLDNGIGYGSSTTAGWELGSLGSDAKPVVKISRFIDYFRQRPTFC